MGIAGAIVGASAVTGIAGGIASSNAANTQAKAAESAANTQAQAENYAAQVQQNQYQQTRADLSPYNNIGINAANNIVGSSPFSFGKFSYDPFSFNPTQAQLEQTPGYQFNLSQGLKATQNSYAAQGLGTSGAALKGAATFASGLADSTYQNQFTNALQSYQQNYGSALQNFQTNYNTALGAYNTNIDVQQNLANLGENAAAQTGNYGTQTAANIGQTAVGAANASAAGRIGAANAGAAGTIGVANAFTGAANGAANGYMLNNFFNNSNNGAGGSIYSPYPGQAGYGSSPGAALPEFY